MDLNCSGPKPTETVLIQKNIALLIKTKNCLRVHSKSTKCFIQGYLCICNNDTDYTVYTIVHMYYNNLTLQTAESYMLASFNSFPLKFPRHSNVQEFPPFSSLRVMFNPQ